MAMMGGGSAAPQPTQYLFIDGGYLSRVLSRASDRYFGGIPLDINYRELAGHARKTFYYDCLPGRKEGESDADFEARTTKRQAYFDILKEERGWHVQLGTVKGEGNKLRQKQVDTLLSVEMLAHSYRRNASEIALIAGDLDFKPAVDALVQDGMYVILYYDKLHVSKELKAAADDRREIAINTIRNWLTPEFRKQHPLPVASSSPAKPLVEHPKLKTGKLEDGREAVQWRDGPEYLVTFPCNHNAGYEITVQDQSEERIDKFIEDIYCKITWSLGAKPL